MTAFLWSERSAVTLTSAGSSLTTGSAGSAGTDLDVRTTASENAKGDFTAAFLLICQWGTVTGIVAGTIIGDLYLVPKIDGTNAPQLDTTAGSSRLPYATRVGSFEATKAPTTSTDTYFIVPDVDLQPLLYTAYLLNRSGQTISANWTLKVVSAQVEGV
jgi:hypothetical protein